MHVKLANKYLFENINSNNTFNFYICPFCTDLFTYFVLPFLSNLSQISIDRFL